jgi:hypothetical protein
MEDSLVVAIKYTLNIETESVSPNNQLNKIRVLPS